MGVGKVWRGLTGWPPQNDRLDPPLLATSYLIASLHPKNRFTPYCEEQCMAGRSGFWARAGQDGSTTEAYSEYGRATQRHDQDRARCRTRTRQADRGRRNSTQNLHWPGSEGMPDMAQLHCRAAQPLLVGSGVCTQNCAYFRNEMVRKYPIKT